MMTPVQPDTALPAYPNGWYAVGFADELPRRGVLVRRFMGGEIVLYRTEGGAACAVEPHCPHLGAHLGHGGRVEGESLRCPFHGFCFDRAGACVSTPYGKRLPKARLGTHRVREQSGLLLVFHDAEGRAPEWEVPPLDMSGWTPLSRRTTTLRGHPQETTENSVDVGHLAVVHGYRGVTEVTPLEMRGAHLTVRYAFDRRTLGPLPRMRIEFTIHAHGLGYSLVETDVPELGVQSRQFVLATPIGDRQITMRIALGLRAAPDHRWANRIVRGPIARALAEVLMLGFAADARQDHVIWGNKRYLSPPVLAEGDGPIGAYRRWARQFYPGRGADAAVVTGTTS